MPPSPRPLVLKDFPSSPSSAWSLGSGLLSPSLATQDHPSPPTPESCFPAAATIARPDEFALHIDFGLDKSSVSLQAANTYYLPGEDMTKEQVLLRNMGRQGNMYDRFESSPPLCPRNISRVSPSMHMPPENATDYFSWEATGPTLANANELSDPLRYSLLIQEVSLLVGLAADDDHLFSGEGGSLVLDGTERAPSILPLSPPPTKSLASRKQRNVSPPHPTDSPSNNPISSNINPCADLFAGRMLIEKQPSFKSTESAAPVSRHKVPNAICPSPSPHRRQGRLFHLKSPLPDPPHRRAIDLDKTFVHPREPPPKPTKDSPSNRCSSLDRLERSLLKLEAYAPGNHRESQSEGQPSNHVAQRRDKCPSLPPPRRLTKQHSNYERPRRSPSHSTHDRPPLDPLQPLSKPTPFHQYVRPQVHPAVPSHNELRGEDTPGSFMDMDIPQTEAPLKSQASFPKKKMKNIIIIARRLSRGVIAWGKNLAGSTKPSLEETTAVQSPPS